MSNIDLENLPFSATVSNYGHQFRRYSLLVFVVVVVGCYGWLLFRINTLSAAQPSDDTVSAQVNSKRLPHIDPHVVQQVQSLQDNSVSVKTLFNQTRDNPFQQ